LIEILKLKKRIIKMEILAETNIAVKEGGIFNE